jgi:hypothetical protein
MPHFITNSGCMLSEELQPKDKKTTVNLAIDSTIIDSLKRDAKSKGMSLNARINAILLKYIEFYKRAEEVDDTCVIPKKYFQFTLDKIDEKENTREVAEMHRIWIPAFFNDLNLPFTLDNFVKYAVKQIGVNARTIDNITYQSDDEGNHMLSFTHRFGIKWSKVASSSIAVVIEEFFHYGTQCYIYPGNFVVKILKRGS